MGRNFSRLVVAASATLVIGALASASQAQTAAYVRSTSEPWGSGSNISNMNAVFGVGGWESDYYPTVNPASLFDASHCFIYMDGGDGNAGDMANFLGANHSVIENWVASGGSLFLNAAPWSGYGDPVYGFDVALDGEPYYSKASYTGGAAAPGHVIFTDMGFGNPGTSWSGNYFSHAIVTGENLNNLINGTAGSVLGEESWGLGHLMVGGMTNTSFHGPQPQADILRENILKYGAAQCNQVTSVPEPGAVAFGVLSGASVIGLIARKRKA